MATVFDYVGEIVWLSPDEIPSDILNEWRETLKNEQGRIYNSLMTKIPNESAFQSRIADASSDAYEGFVNPSFENADVIKMKQRVKLARSYNAWNTGVADAFGEGGYFADRVENKADKFKLAAYTVSNVGHKPTRFFGPLVKAIMFLVGDTRVLRYLDVHDVYTGDPTNVFKAGHSRFIKPMLVARGVFGAVMAKFADEGGLTSLRDSIISDVNSKLDEAISAFVDSANYSNVYLHLELSDGVWKWHSHAETVA